jgi:hypothetical protein
MRGLSLLALFAFLLSGCAFSGLSRDHGVQLEPVLDEAARNKDIRVSINCGEKIYSSMLSPLVPLPPIVPTPIRPPAIVIVDMRRLEAGFSELTISGGVGGKNESYPPSTFEFHKSGTGALRLPYSCQKLEGARLSLRYPDLKNSADRIETFLLRYTEGDLELHWGYLQ